MAIILAEETGKGVRGGFRRTEGGNPGKVREESLEGLQTSQDDP